LSISGGQPSPAGARGIIATSVPVMAAIRISATIQRERATRLKNVDQFYGASARS